METQTQGATGQGIRTAREKAGITQAELGYVVHCTPSAISNYERGTRHVPADVAASVATLTACPIPYGIEGRKDIYIVPKDSDAGELIAGLMA